MRIAIVVVLLAVCFAATWLLWPRGGASKAGPEKSNGASLTVDVGPESALKPEKYDGPVWFQTVTDHGIDFVHQTGNSPVRPFPAANGSGMAAIDFDLDGFCDLYLATGTPFPIQPTETTPKNRIYRNRGDWRFEDVTEETGLGHNGYSTGLAVGDYDADGFADVYVCCYGPDQLFQNQGDGTFRRVTLEPKDGGALWATSAAFFDYDSDGALDIYVCQYGAWTLETNKECATHGIRSFCHPSTLVPEKDILYRGRGDGTFEDATEASGIGKYLRRGQGVVAADLNNDGLIDLYLGNDMNANSYLTNLGDGTFKDRPNSGAGYSHKGHKQAGMGVDAADVNRDGRMDMIVTNFSVDHNALYLNAGADLFNEVSHNKGLAADGFPYVGWGVLFADLDLDTWPDLVIVNGHLDINRPGEPYPEPDMIWRNMKGRFRLVGAEAGPHFSTRLPSRALTMADLDNDGDQDLVTGQQDMAPILLRNECLAPGQAQRRVFTVKLVGVNSNRDAVGAALTLKTSKRSSLQQIKGGGSYQSAAELRRFFAVQPGEEDLTLEIRWPNRQTSIVKGLQSGVDYVIIEPTDPMLPPRIFPEVRHE